jgi:hypothetical protein
MQQLPARPWAAAPEEKEWHRNHHDQHRDSRHRSGRFVASTPVTTATNCSRKLPSQWLLVETRPSDRTRTHLSANESVWTQMRSNGHRICNNSWERLPRAVLYRWAVAVVALLFVWKVEATPMARTLPALVSSRNPWSRLVDCRKGLHRRGRSTFGHRHGQDTISRRAILDDFDSSDILDSTSSSTPNKPSRKRREDRNVGGYDPSEQLELDTVVNVGNPQIRVSSKERSVTSILRELSAIQQQGPQKYCILGTRHCSFLHQQIIELL